MMAIKNIAITILCMFLCLSCQSEHKKISVSFNGVDFSLPNKVLEVKNNYYFKYSTYRGFRSKIQDYEVVLQLKESPLWVSSENVDESFYDNQIVVGITFIAGINKKEKVEYDLSILSKRYSKSFIKYANGNFEYFKTRDGLFIAVSIKKSKYYISFYNGVTEKDLSNYVNNVW
jgi:hypothetical protein